MPISQMPSNWWDYLNRGFSVSHIRQAADDKTAYYGMDVREYSNRSDRGLYHPELALLVDTFSHAGKTMLLTQNAVEMVSEMRANLGALQNRLEHTVSNLDNISENTQASESRIRDTDMAEEMVTYSKNNILAQAGQAMLSQANQSSQGMLALLG